MFRRRASTSRAETPENSIVQPSIVLDPVLISPVVGKGTDLGNPFGKPTPETKGLSFVALSIVFRVGVADGVGLAVAADFEADGVGLCFTELREDEGVAVGPACSAEPPHADSAKPITLVTITNAVCFTNFVFVMTFVRRSLVSPLRSL